MHRCLIIDEIVQAIFCSLHDNYSLFSLARTCRAFEDPALNSLWCTQTSLKALFKCLPRDIRKEVVDHESVDELTPRLTLRRKREPIAEDWARFESYARRIRVLICQRNNDERIDEELYQALIYHFQDSPALPNLRELQCLHGATAYKYLHVFLTPRLAQLNLSLFFHSGPTPAVIQSIGTACPSLRKFKLQAFCYIELRGSHHSYTELFRNLRALESLHCALPLPPATIIHLSRLSTLTEIDFFDHPRAITQSLSGASVPPFAQLTILRINAWDGPSTAELLRILCLTQLKTLKITFHCPMDYPPQSTVLIEHDHSVLDGYSPSWPNDSDLAQILVAVGASCTSLQSLAIMLSPKKRRPGWGNIPRPVFSAVRLASSQKRFSAWQRNFRTLDDVAAVLSGLESEKLFTIIYVSGHDIASGRSKRDPSVGWLVDIGMKGNFVTGVRLSFDRIDYS